MRIHEKPDIKKAIENLQKITEIENPLSWLEINELDAPTNITTEMEEIAREHPHGLEEDGAIVSPQIDDPLVQEILENPECITELDIKILNRETKGHARLSPQNRPSEPYLDIFTESYKIEKPEDIITIHKIHQILKENEVIPKTSTIEKKSPAKEQLQKLQKEEERLRENLDKNLKHQEKINEILGR